MPQATTVKGSVKPFDTFNGQQVFQFSLTNAHGVTVSALTLGATLYEILLPNGDNLVLNYHHSADYLANPFYVCMAIGRTGGRIGGGEFPLNGKTVHVPVNEGSTTLHGGPHGFNSQLWDGEIATHAGQAEIIFRHVQKSSEDGFPGDLDAEIHYQLSEDDQVNVVFISKSSADTVFNPTLHTYFNLGHDDTIKDHTLQINSEQHLAFDDKKVPTGDLIDVDQTPFDFRETASLGAAIDGMQQTPEKGFDDLFKVTPAADKRVATLTDTHTGHAVDVLSKRNGLVVFTANSFTHDNMNFKRSNGTGHPYEGVALEAQTLPDATKHTGFGNIVLTAGDTTTQTIGYRLHY
ncbi:MAG TPA: galactose mutarotase, partial [Lactobacillus sp.]|nr:galactose mutarotase [Lactobacillus sp.]